MLAQTTVFGPHSSLSSRANDNGTAGTLPLSSMPKREHTSARGQSPLTVQVRGLEEERNGHGQPTAKGPGPTPPAKFQFCGKSAENRLVRTERRPIATQPGYRPMLPA